jgi:hypothetical protein
MITFDFYGLDIATQEVFDADWPNIWRLGVVVFTRPEDSICKEIIGPSLHYLHELTGKKVHFYFVGFFDRRFFEYTERVRDCPFGIDSNWYFSPRIFADVQMRFEGYTSNRWSYSGGTDLLIVPYRIRKHVFYVDNRKALDLKLSKIKANSKAYIPEEVIQIIVRQLRQGKDIDGVSNSRIITSVSEGLKQTLLKLCPTGISDSFAVLEPFSVKSFIPES